MKRYIVIKNIINLLNDNDIVVFSGKEMCKEAYEYNKDNFFYIEDSIGISIPIALGLAMCTDKRVFVFVGEGELLRETGALNQIGASKCRNMFLVILDNDCYQSAGGSPNIFSGLLSKKGFIYNANMKVSSFDKHFKDRLFKQVGRRFERLVGPMAILMKVDKGLKKNLEEANISYEDQFERISKLAQDKDKTSAMFVSPISMDPNSEINTLNVDSLKIGGIS